jgi:hypothetical protein
MPINHLRGCLLIADLFIKHSLSQPPRGNAEALYLPSYSCQYINALFLLLIQKRSIEIYGQFLEGFNIIFESLTRKSKLPVN